MVEHFYCIIQKSVLSATSSRNVWCHIFAKQMFKLHITSSLTAKWKKEEKKKEERQFFWLLGNSLKQPTNQTSYSGVGRLNHVTNLNKRDIDLCGCTNPTQKQCYLSFNAKQENVLLKLYEVYLHLTTITAHYTKLFHLVHKKTSC